MNYPHLARICCFTLCTSFLVAGCTKEQEGPLVLDSPVAAADAPRLPFGLSFSVNHVGDLNAGRGQWRGNYTVMDLSGYYRLGANEERGWTVAGVIVPIAYVAWSLWLIALGVSLLL